MPLQARIGADFGDFRRALEQIQGKMNDFGSSTTKLTNDLNKLTQSFSGVGIKREAELIAKAVAQVGGAAALTATEQKRVNAVMVEALAKYKALGTEAPAALKQLEAATRGAGSAASAAGPSFLSMATAVAAGTAAYHALVAVGRQVFAFMEASIKAAVEGESATARLAAALRQQGTYTPALLAQYVGLSKQYQALTTNSDEAARAAETMLVMIGNVGPKEMDRAMRATMDLSAGLGKDLPEAAFAVGKALGGNVTALQRMVPELKGLEGSAKSASGILDVLGKAGFGGMAQADAATMGGRLKQLANAWDEVQESVGGAIVKNQTVATVLADVTQQVFGASDALEGQSAATQAVSDATIFLVRALALGVDAYGSAVAGLDLLRLAYLSLGWAQDKVAAGVQGYLATMLKVASVGSPLYGVLIKESERWQATADRSTKGAAEFKAELDKWGPTTASAAIGTAATAEGLRAYADSLEKTRGKTVELTGTTADHVRTLAGVKGTASEAEKAIQSLYDSMTGIKATNELATLLAVWEKLTPAQRENVAVQDRVAEVYGKLRPFLASYPPDLEAMYQVSTKFTAALKALNDEAKNTPKDLGLPSMDPEQLPMLARGFSGWTTSMSQAVLEGKHFGDALTELSRGPLANVAHNVGWVTVTIDGQTKGTKEAAKETTTWSQGLGMAANVMATLGQTIGGTTGKVLQMGAGVLAGVSAMQSATTAAERYSAAMSMSASSALQLYVYLKDLEKKLFDAKVQMLDFIDAQGGRGNLNEQLSLAGWGTAGFTEAMNQAWDSADELAAVVDQATRALERLRKQQEASQQATGFVTQMIESWGKSAVQTQTQFERLGTYLVGAFIAAFKATGSVLSAIDAIGEGLDALASASDKFGFKAGSALAQLLEMRDIKRAFSDILLPLDLATQAVKALATAGVRTKDIYDALGGDVVDAFTRLLTGGVGRDKALLMMQPALQELWKASQQFRVTLDPATQALIDEAKAAGFVGPDVLSIAEQQLEELGAIKQVLIDNALAITGQAQPRPPEGTPTPPGGANPRRHEGGLIRLHAGGLLSDEVPAILQTGERVLNRRDTRTYDALLRTLQAPVMPPPARPITFGGSAPAGGVTQTIIVELDGYELAKATARNLPAILRLNGSES